MFVLGLECMNCHKEYSLQRMFEGCPNCRSEGFVANLVVNYDFKEIKKKLNRKILEQRGKVGLSKYLELLPIENGISFGTLGEGSTPLIQCKKLGQELGIEKLYIKDESRNPTGSFKDRLAFVGTTIALQFGSKNIVAAGGNMAAATAAYGAKCGLGVISLETLTESNIAILQTIVYGGNVVMLERYDQRYALMKRCVDEYGCHPVSSYTHSPTGDPYSQEGSKTIAYEICEELGWRSPDKVIVPTGQGFCLHGIWNGFRDFYQIGLIDSLPSMFAAESASGGSLAITKDVKNIKTVEPKETVARHAVAARGSYKGFRAIIDSGGSSITLMDKDVLEAVDILAKKEGIFSSATSATAIAALKKYVIEGKIEKDEIIVCIITAGGFKDADILSQALPSIPRPIAEDWELFVTFLAENYNFVLSKLAYHNLCQRRKRGTT